MSGGVGLSIDKVQTSLNLFYKCIQGNLTEDGRDALFDLANTHPKRKRGSKWRFSISEDCPVEFIAGQPDIADELHPEFFGHIEGPGEKWTFSDYSICFRVWSSKKNYNFWSPTDSELAKTTFMEDEERRLILRLRFDLHENLEGAMKSHHPWFHMQIGGKSSIEHLNPREVAPAGHYRYPPSIDTPRIPTFPMSFILLGRFIMANYHPRDYTSLCIRNHEWKSLIAKEEKLMWKEFIRGIKSFLTAELKYESCFDRIGMNSKHGWQ